MPEKTRVFQTNLDLRQLENLGERVDAVGVGRERVHALAAEDGGGHGSQSVAAQVQLLQLLRREGGPTATLLPLQWQARL